MTGGPVAVVDIGSGAVKLLITGPDGLTRLGAELVHTGAKTKLMNGDGDRMPAESLADTAAAFDRFAALMAEHQVTATAVVATAVARTAVNVQDLHDLVERSFDVPLQVLSGDREAELALIGATAGRDIAGRAAVVDVGAGSTEFAIRLEDGSVVSHSLPIGSQQLIETYLLGDPHRPEELSSALTVMELHLDDLKRELPELSEAMESGTMLGVGAVIQIAAVEVGSSDPGFRVDGYRMAKTDLEEVFRALATETAAERAFNPGLRPEHVGDIVGAMCVLVEFARQYSMAEILVSERGLMHGLVADLLAKR